MLADADWTSFKDRPCTMLALNPNNADHIFYTHPPMTYQTTDGGKTWESLNKSGIFHCGASALAFLSASLRGVNP